MTKKEMAAKLAKKCGLPLAKAEDIVDAIFDTAPGKGIIAIDLDAGRQVKIPGFGTFPTVRRRARVGRNPATGETLHFSA